jgi:hypothetical protein
VLPFLLRRRTVRRCDRHPAPGAWHDASDAVRNQGAMPASG